MEKVMVTGANGFVGRRLCADLTSRGYEVLAAVRRPCRDLPVADSRIHICPNLTADAAHLMEGLQTVVHLAARVHQVRELSSDPLTEFREANVELTCRLAEQAAAAGVRRFLFVSSIKANEVPERDLFCEEPSNSDFYSLSKREAELKLLELSARSGMEVLIIRPCLVYGPEVRANFLQLLRLIQTGMPLPLARIDNLRSFIFVNNLTDALAYGIKADRPTKQIYPVSDFQDISTVELIRSLAHAAGKKARLFSFPPQLLLSAGRLIGREALVERLTGSLVIGDVSFKEELGWKPPYTFKEGIEQTVEWYIRTRKGA
ncbi:NAD-dependent epimerase/dehydratase family protein [Saccharibacillus sp. CPCC 101409]|uniref:NAD-dependent epimerase/dehydratase family protein n=1 Tax=Saccharibacillus sp. CPCC 101409 TaxID=3058041 RepID=UPI0026737311|nr:NAD-dependent epimerase/dehydratase family protein [Saccharibacillus sp. CPCC 101409]MDO3412018.1 NAD-dependent epimerase/dehydratase family protein [Saccharibacillus sp. CPCC 101409]